VGMEVIEVVELGRVFPGGFSWHGWILPLGSFCGRREAVRYRHARDLVGAEACELRGHGHTN
jgi:hypothetical protein